MNALLDNLRQHCGADRVLSEPTDLIPYSFDGTAELRQMPTAVVFPRNTAGVAACVKAAVRNGIPIVTRGAGTGLSGGSVPVPGCLVICMVDLKAILAVDPANLTLRAPPGAITADVLLANGCEVHTPPLQPCCGSLHAHNGAPELARELARRLIDLLPPDRDDAIITNSGGCGSHLLHYGKLLAGDSAYATRARLWDSKLRDIHEWLIEAGCRPPVAAPQDDPLTTTCHDSCHLVHGQKVIRQPRELLDRIPGVTTIPLPEASWCCGSAGIYNITRPETSAALMERKVGHVLATGASHLATGNPGCHLQLARSLADAGSPVKLIHPVTLLARAYRRESLT